MEVWAVSSGIANILWIRCVSRSEGVWGFVWLVLDLLGLHIEIVSAWIAQAGLDLVLFALAHPVLVLQASSTTSSQLYVFNDEVNVGILFFWKW